jgi:hypothetical protein
MKRGHLSNCLVAFLPIAFCLQMLQCFLFVPSPIYCLFGWLVADGWCWFVLREEYCWLMLVCSEREMYCWLVADKPNEHALNFVFLPVF